MRSMTREGWTGSCKGSEEQPVNKRSKDNISCVVVNIDYQEEQRQQLLYHRKLPLLAELQPASPSSVQLVLCQISFTTFCYYSYYIVFNLDGNNPPPKRIKVSKILLFVQILFVLLLQIPNLYVHVHQQLEKKGVEGSLVNLAPHKLHLRGATGWHPNP